MPTCDGDDCRDAAVARCPACDALRCEEHGGVAGVECDYCERALMEELG